MFFDFAFPAASSPGMIFTFNSVSHAQHVRGKAGEGIIPKRRHCR